jgi:hypothetical protein
MILVKILFRSSFNTPVTTYTDSTSKRRQSQQTQKIEERGKNNKIKRYHDLIKSEK